MIERIVESIGRLDLTIELRQSLLDPLADTACELAELAENTVEQHHALSVARILASQHPGKLARVAEIIRTRCVSVGVGQTLHGDTPIPRAHVLAGLSWELYRSARGASTGGEREAILRELAGLVDIESADADSTHRNTGRGAAELLRRVVHEWHGYTSRFDAEATMLANRLLEQLERGEEPLESTRVVIGAVTALERADTWVPYESPNTVTFAHHSIDPGGNAGETVGGIRVRLWSIVTNDREDFSPAAKGFAWKTLRSIHTQMNRYDREGSLYRWLVAIKDDLERCYTLMKSQVSLKTLQQARALWEWHRKWGDDDLRVIAANCERLYHEHPSVHRYASVFGVDIDKMRAVEEGASHWPEAATSSQLEEYLEGALHFTRTHADEWREPLVASFVQHLGAIRGESVGIRDFMEMQIRRGSSTEMFDFALLLASASVASARELGADETSVRLNMLDGFFPGDESRMRFLDLLYRKTNCIVASKWTTADGDFMDRYQHLMETLPTDDWAFVLGRRLGNDVGMEARIIDYLQDLEGLPRLHALSAVFDGVIDMVSSLRQGGNLPVTAMEFILGQLSHDGDIDIANNYLAQDFLKDFPRRSIAWIVGVIRRRIDLGKLDIGIEMAPGKISLLLSVVMPLTDSPPGPEDGKAITSLVHLATNRPELTYVISSLSATLDPHGRVAPRAIAEKLHNVAAADASPNTIAQWGAFAEKFAVDSPAWRTIACAACLRISSTWTERDRLLVFTSFSSRWSTWGGYPGELHPRFQRAIDKAVARLNRETDPALRPYWQWQLECAQSELAHQMERLEERDE